MTLRSRVGAALKTFEQPFAIYNEITVSRTALLHNFDLLKLLSPAGLVIPVLKANAYGHGLDLVAEVLRERSMPYIAVDGYYEALRIREVSPQSILVMGAIRPENFAHMNLKGMAFVVHDEEVIRALGALKRWVPVHLEVDTGMSRHGVPLHRLQSFLSLLSQYPQLELEGVMSHLVDADNPTNSSLMERQATSFDAAVAQVKAAGLALKYLHLSASSGSAKLPSRTANVIRPDIALYGVSPLQPSDEAFDVFASLEPSLTLKSVISKVLEIAEGETVGYGATYTAKRSSRIGVLPLGYYEGVPVTLSNTGSVQINGELAPIAGRVCMNHTMIDITDTEAKYGDVVVVFGADGPLELGINELCREHKLFNYELLVRLNQNVRRRLVP